MKKYTIYTDLHLYSKYFNEPKFPWDKDVIERENAYLIGDIFEAKNCEPKDLHALKTDRSHAAFLYEGRMLRGNHDGNFPGVDDIVLPGRILLTHGDRVLWTKEKSDKFRAEKMGQGSGWKQWIFSKHHGSINQSEAELASRYAEARNCTTVVFGHVHPKVRFDKVIGNVRVICLPRGRNEIYL